MSDEIQKDEKSFPKQEDIFVVVRIEHAYNREVAANTNL